MYAEIFDGLRGYYAMYENRRAAAGFHAAMTMSFICSINIGVIIALVDYFVNGNLSRSVAFFQNKILLILVGIGIAYAHVLFGKYTGRYDSVDPAKSSRWKRYLIVYGCTSAALLFGAVSASLFT